ncbi:4-hydroxy-tetrahydrodipicolinate reductase [soil metagenome]
MNSNIGSVTGSPSPAAEQQSLGIAITGASGRMGHMLIEAVSGAPDCKLVGALDVAGSASIGQDASAFLGKPSGVAITSEVESALADARVLIDFTRPDGTLAYLAACRQRGVNVVIGTTGFTPEQKEQIALIARDIAIVMAPNMSVGVNVVLKLLDMAARSLNEGYDIEIIETHHRHKVDAPSGTALKMGEVVASALGRTLDECAVYGRQGLTGARDPSTIGFAAIRGGDVVGDHTVMFAGTGERIEITHKSSSRAGYAQGSLRAARFLADKKTGLYGMDDVLGTS